MAKPCCTSRIAVLELEIHLFNALFLSILYEYEHQSLLKTTEWAKNVSCYKAY